MKAYNEKRIFIEYARVQRLIAIGSLFTLPDFSDDLFQRLKAAQDSDEVGLFRGHRWTLGNLFRPEGSKDFSGQLGWYEMETDPEAIPPRDPVTHSWLEETESIRVGALALFAVDATSQRVAITSRSGDVTTYAFCNAMTQILNNQEISARAAASNRPDVDWLVERVTEPGVFRSWMARQDTVKSVTISFHLPNPSIDDDIKPMTDFLAQTGATTGLVRATNNRGGTLTPENNELLRAGMAMQERDYADINASGIQGGREDKFNSKEHAANDKIEVTVPSRPTIAEALEILGEAIRERLRREGSSRHETT